MKNFKIITLISLSLYFCTSIGVYSQGNVSIHIGPSIPVSSFASDDMNDEYACGAAVGINAGLQYTYQFPEICLGLFGGVDFHYCGLKNSVKDDIKEVFEDNGIDASFKFYKYINIPLTVGLNHTFQANDKIGFFVYEGLALNFLKITDMEIRASGQTATSEIELAERLGLKVGGGIILKNKTTISVDYYGLGIHKIKGEATAPGYSEDIEGKAKVDLLTVTLGIKF